MKVILPIFMLVLVNFAFAQDPAYRDPSYSEANYKHPNKAAYARKHNLDRLTSLSIVSVTADNNYKQPFNSKTAVQKAALAAKPMSKSSVSYKHPYGL